VTRKDIDPDIEELIQAALSDRLTDDEQRRLEQFLTEDDDVLSADLHYCQLETDLYFRIRATLAGRRAIVDLCLDGSPPEAAERSVSLPAAVDDSAKHRFRGLNRRALATLAAVLLLGVFAWWASTYWGEILPLRQPQPIACLTEANDAQWLGDVAPPVGQSFVEGDSVYLTKGHARISMSSGAEMVLRGPCFVTLSTADRVKLEEGVVTTQVAEWGRGFTVLTDALQVVDLGTKFAVSTNATGVAEAHVLDGQVRIMPVSATVPDRRSLLLFGGEAIRVESGRKVATRIKADRALYDAKMGDQPPFKPIQIFNTGVGLVPGDEDPHWRVTSGPNGAQFRGPQFAVVCDADSRYLANDPSRSQWLSVSNPVRPGVPPSTLFTFETTFNLTGYNLSTVMVAAQLIADNGVREVRVNGEPIPLKPWVLNERDQLFNRFVIVEIRDGFVAGTNHIEFDIWNGVDRYLPDKPNPLALRVEWQAFGRPIDMHLAAASVAGPVVE
jgi:hypothetical protein